MPYYWDNDRMYYNMYFLTPLKTTLSSHSQFKSFFRSSQVPDWTDACVLRWTPQVTLSITFHSRKLICNGITMEHYNTSHTPYQNQTYSPIPRSLIKSNKLFFGVRLCWIEGTTSCRRVVLALPVPQRALYNGSRLWQAHHASPPSYFLLLPC